MGAVLTQRPDIARAVVAAVPVMDSLRAETTTNGRFNTPEYGTVEDPGLFTVLLALPQCRGRDGLPSRVADRRAERHPRRCLACQEDDGPAPGGNLLRPASAAETGVHRPPGRVARPGHRRDHRLTRLPLRPARSRLPPRRPGVIGPAARLLQYPRANPDPVRVPPGSVTVWHYLGSKRMQEPSPWPSRNSATAGNR